MKKIFIDPGHGGKDPGATGNGLREKDINLTIALKIRSILNNNYEGHSVKMSRITDKTVSLFDRTNIANTWEANYLVSIHVNAGGGTGFESFIYNGNDRNKSTTNQLRSVIHEKVIKDVDFRDRGKKEANFHMLRESNMSAVLTESGFIDNGKDAQKLKSDAFLTKIAKAHADGIAEALDLRRKVSGKYYRVITGSFKNQENAARRMRQLRERELDSFITTTNQQGEVFYRVVTGSFKKRSNAKLRMDELKALGFYSFIDIYE